MTKKINEEYIKMRTDQNILDLITTEGFSRHDIACFRAARDAALRSDYGNIRIGCVLSYKGTIIGSGSNMKKSDPDQRHYNMLYRAFNEPRRFSPKEHSIHAEIAAIKSVPYTKAISINWSKVKAYVYRVSPGKQSFQGLSKPCAACSHALYDKGIKTVYYSDDYGFGKFNFSKEIMDTDKPHNSYHYKSEFELLNDMIEITPTGR